MLRFDKATYLSLLFMFVLSARFSNSLWESDVLLISEFINIVSILFYDFIEFIILSYTFLVNFFARYSPVSKQYSRKFAECSLSIAILETSREHLENSLREKIFLKVLSGKVVFVLNVYDLIITNVELLANFSNHEVIFPEYLRNIPQMPVSKIFQGYPWNIVKLWKYF